MSDALAHFTRNLLSYGRETHRIVEAADAHPGDATLNAYAAASILFAMTPAAREGAAPYLDRARAAAVGEDERLLVAAVAAWRRGDLPAAIDRHRARLRLRPDDRAAAKICQLHHLDRGDFEGMVETIALSRDHHPDDPYVLGQLAFALEEAGRVDEAEPIASRALALGRAAGIDDPWSVHAAMHVHHRRGRLAESIALVEAHAELWDRCGAFMAIHAWWHAAVAALELGRADEALALYDARLTEVDPACVQSLVARISLLARLRLAGQAVGNRWAPLVPALRERAADGINGFLDVHFVYGLALAGEAEAARDAAARLEGLSSRAAEALILEAAGDAAAAARRLATLAPSLAQLGGSHEQRELYHLVAQRGDESQGWPAAA